MLLEKSKLFSKEYKKTISEALNVLGKKNLALILQGVSFPSHANENTGFGTYNSQGARELFDYVKDIFSAVQLGPCGKTKLSDSSPYTGTVFSKNPLFRRIFPQKQIPFKLPKELYKFFLQKPIWLWYFIYRRKL